MMNWGMIGYGEITPSFILALQATNKANLVSIASISSAEILRTKNIYPNVEILNSYDELLNKKDINVIYVSTTNNLHYKNVKLALTSGKHVLCEKPLTPNLNQTKKLFEFAKKNNLFLMEGMWTRFLPCYKKFIEILLSGIIGQVKLLKADFGFSNNWSPNRRLLNPELFGGTLLDNADYNIFLSQNIFKQYPSNIAAHATFTETGVEDSCSIILKYETGGLAQLFSSFRCRTKQEAIVYGEYGYIKMQEYWHGTKLELIVYNKNKESFEFPHRVNGFEFEIEAVQNSILQAKKENEIVPHSASIEVAKIIDEVKSLI